MLETSIPATRPGKKRCTQTSCQAFRRPRAEPRGARKGQAGSRTAPQSLPGVRCLMATPSLRGRLARLGNPRKPILKPNKPLILANRVGERRREKGGEQSEPRRLQSGSREGAGVANGWVCAETFFLPGLAWDYELV